MYVFVYTFSFWLLAARHNRAVYAMYASVMRIQLFSFVLCPLNVRFSFMFFNRDIENAVPCNYTLFSIY